jgi:hypothetical protein
MRFFKMPKNKAKNSDRIGDPLSESDSLLSKKEMEGVRVFATTVIRGSSNREMTGFLFELDWNNGRIERKVPIPLDTKHPFWNARGGNRGGRGVFVYDGKLYVATSMSILIYDTDLMQIGEICHPFLAGIHEIFVSSDGIWVTSTVHDGVVKLDFLSNVTDSWWGSESRLLQEELGYSGRTLRLKLDFPRDSFFQEYERYCAEERLHVNAVWQKEEDVFVLSCRKKAVVQIRPGPERIIFQDEELASPHNCIVTEKGLAVINDTQNQRIRIYDLSSGKMSRTVPTVIYDQMRSEQFANAGWQRGLARVRDSVYLVGTSPATIYEADISTGKVGRVWPIDDDVRHCIHGLCVAEGF